MRFALVRLLVIALAVANVARAQPGLDSIVPRSPAPNGFIADGGPVLDAAALARLNAHITRVQATTGGDIAVAVVRDLHDRAPVDVGVAIYRAWKVGRRDSIGSARRNLGALLLIVPKELAPSKRGECWVTSGTGAEGELRDADAGTICRDSVIPRLREKAYEAAIDGGIGGIAAAFERTVAGVAPPASVGISAAPGHRSPGRTSAVLAIILSLMGAGGGTMGLLAYRRRKPRQCPRGHGRMVRLSEVEDDGELSQGQRREEQIGSVDYDVWACPQCPERIVIPYSRWSAYGQCANCGFKTVRKDARTLVPASMVSTGVEELTLTCENCGRVDVTQRVLPRIPPPSSSSSGGGGGGGDGGGGGSSFGGGGSTSGGGGGGSY